MQCDYWCNDDNEQWCDLAGSECKCGGKEVECALSDKSVSAAFREQEKMTMRETALRAQKRRMKEAS
ncbi:MAG: hypothetical protein M1133_03755 [Armatimonadetes bacterium]|nr:hypothetical protein [Armatimonadota bacterium]